MNEETQEIYEFIFKEQIQNAKENPEKVDINTVTDFGTNPKPGEKLLMFVCQEKEEDNTTQLIPKVFNYPSELSSVFRYYEFQHKIKSIPSMTKKS